MKLSIMAAAAVFALSSAAFAQNGSSGGLNGGTLGLSQPGVNSGVPYPNPATADPAPEETERTAPVSSSGANVPDAATPKASKKSAKVSHKKKAPTQSGASTQAAVKPAPPSPGASPPR